jgi:isoleucyl-tRNA synthetase
MAKLMAPVLSFTADEIWSFMPGKKEESVFLSSFPEVDARFLDKKLEDKWAALVSVRNEVNKSIEIKRQERFLGNSLEANVTLFVKEGGELPVLLKGYSDFLTTLFIVSQSEIKTGTPPERAYSCEIILRSYGYSGQEYEAEVSENLSILIERASGKKCERCWNWSAFVGTFERAPELCDRCYNNTLK